MDCPEDGKSSFISKTEDALLVPVRELVDIAKRAKKREPALTEYAVAIR